MHMDPVTHAGQYLAAIEAAQLERARAHAIMAAAFVKECAHQDANALATFAPMVNDWEAAKRMPRDIKAPMPQRYQTVTEVMVDAMDYARGPSMTEAMQLILNVAYGTDLVNAPAQARALISRMAEAFAHYNAED